MTVKAFIYKEYKEHIRKFRFLIIAILSMFFAFSTPVILYFLPKLLAAQAGSSMDLSGLFTLNQTTAITNYMNDMYEITGMLILVFGANLLLKEYHSKSIVIPMTNGLNNAQMIFTKYCVYMLMVLFITLISYTVNHFYSGLVFQMFNANFIYTLHGYLSFNALIGFHLAVAFLVASYSKNTLATLGVTLASYYILPQLSKLFELEYGPYNLLFSFSHIPFTTATIINLSITLLGIIVILTVASKKQYQL